LDRGCAQSWLSISVLMLGIAAPLSGIEAKPGASDPQVLPAAAWTSRCAPAPTNADFSGQMPMETSGAGKTCSVDSTAISALVQLTESPGSDLSAQLFQASLDGRVTSGGASVMHLSSAEATSIAGDLDALPPDEKPTGAKIPEPATLALFGAGMITTARVLRIKRQSKYRLRTITERFSRAQLQSVAGD
jgi:hypothetical protein